MCAIPYLDARTSFEKWRQEQPEEQLQYYEDMRITYLGWCAAMDYIRLLEEREHGCYPRSQSKKEGQGSS